MRLLYREQEPTKAKLHRLSRKKTTTPACVKTHRHHLAWSLDSYIEKRNYDEVTTNYKRTEVARKIRENAKWQRKKSCSRWKKSRFLGHPSNLSWMCKSRKKERETQTRARRGQGEWMNADIDIWSQPQYSRPGGNEYTLRSQRKRMETGICNRDKKCR